MTHLYFECPLLHFILCREIVRHTNKLSNHRALKGLDSVEPASSSGRPDLSLPLLYWSLHKQHWGTGVNQIRWNCIDHNCETGSLQQQMLWRDRVRKNLNRIEQNRILVRIRTVCMYFSMKWMNESVETEKTPPEKFTGSTAARVKKGTEQLCKTTFFCILKHTRVKKQQW